MIEIDLITDGGKKRGSKSRVQSAPKVPGGSMSLDPHLIGAILIGVAGVGYFFYASQGQSQLIATHQANLVQAEADSVNYADTIELIESMQLREDTVYQRIEVIRDVDERRYQWPHLLDQISRSLPSYTWLDRIAVVESGRPLRRDTTGATVPAVPPRFAIEGNTGSTQALTLFMKNLETSQFVRNVRLVTSEQITEQGRTFYRFTLEAMYSRPDRQYLRMMPLVQE